MQNPTAAMVVIGDEILSGRTRDANMHFLACELTQKGIDLKEVRVISDDASIITETVKQVAGSYDHVFTSGGIGPTHDDITADCVAAAFGQHIDVRADARDLLQAHYDKTGRELNEARLRMARIPDDATLIENPISIAPGFAIENVYVMAGVPSVFKAMVASVLPGLTGGEPLLSVSERIERGEGDIAGPLAVLAEKYSDLSIGSYPFQDNGLYGANIVARGTDQAQLDAFVTNLKKVFA